MYSSTYLYIPSVCRKHPLWIMEDILRIDLALNLLQLPQVTSPVRFSSVRKSRVNVARVSPEINVWERPREDTAYSVQEVVCRLRSRPRGNRVRLHPQ